MSMSLWSSPFPKDSPSAWKEGMFLFISQEQQLNIYAINISPYMVLYYMYSPILI